MHGHIHKHMIYTNEQEQMKDRFQLMNGDCILRVHAQVSYLNLIFSP